jgi:DNA-binding MarR family transcriptional regulator
MTSLRASSLTKADYQVLAAFRRALRKFTSFSEQAARRAGLTAQQHQALLAIKGSAGVNPLIIGDLAQALLIRPHSAVELVDRLVQLGLVERRGDPADHRRVYVVLTPRADRLLHELSAAHLNELRAIRPVLLDLLSRFEAPPTHLPLPLREGVGGRGRNKNT